MHFLVLHYNYNGEISQKLDLVITFDWMGLVGLVLPKGCACRRFVISGKPTWSLGVLVNNCSKINLKIMKHCTTVHSVSTGFSKKLSNASAHPGK